MSSSGGPSDSGNEDHFDQSDADTDHFDLVGDLTATVMEEDEAGCVLDEDRYLVSQ
jgi:hypothetical protein